MLKLPAGVEEVVGFQCWEVAVVALFRKISSWGWLQGAVIVMIMLRPGLRRPGADSNPDPDPEIKISRNQGQRPGRVLGRVLGRDLGRALDQDTDADADTAVETAGVMTEETDLAIVTGTDEGQGQGHGHDLGPETGTRKQGEETEVGHAIVDTDIEVIETEIDLEIVRERGTEMDTETRTDIMIERGLWKEKMQVYLRQLKAMKPLP